LNFLESKSLKSIFGSFVSFALVLSSQTFAQYPAQSSSLGESELIFPSSFFLSLSQGQFLDRMEDQSYNLRGFSPIGMGIESPRWRWLIEVYQFSQHTGNPTLSITSQQTHFDFSIVRKLASVKLLKPYLGASVKLFRIDADTRIGSVVRSDSSALLYSGGGLLGLDLLEVGPVLISVEFRAFKHERFEPDPSPQGLIRVGLRLR
jgi:hypothetical protein